MGTLPLASIIINAVIVLLALLAWYQIAHAIRQDPKNFTAPGLSSLKYYTVLSNLLAAGTSLVYVAVGLICGLPLPSWLLVLKLMAAASVMLTFLTVIAILGPHFGWKQMYVGGNLWMHLVIPLLAFIDMIAFVPLRTLPFLATLAAIVPTILYGIWYLAQVLTHGAEQDGIVYDFYGFTRWGTSKLPVVAIVVLLVVWCMAVVMYLL